MENKKQKVEKIINIVVYLIQVITSIIVLWTMYVIGSIPLRYIVIAGVVLSLILVGEYFLIFYKKPKSKRSIITQVVSLLLSIVLIIGSNYLYKFGKVVDLMGGNSFQSRAISVITLKDSDILNEKLLEGKKLGMITFMDKDSMDYAVKDINKNIGKVSSVDHKDFNELITALYDKKVDAIILDEAFRELATTDHSHFDEETRVVYQVKKQVGQVNAKNVDVTQKPFLVYISGNDEYGEISAISRSDVNMLVAVNPSTHQVLLVSIPRDTYYPLHRNGQYDKFTHAGMYGLEESLATLQDLLHEDINYYVKLNFTSFMNVIDALDGITIDVPKYPCLHSDDGTFTTKIGKYTISPGINTFDAKHALAFVRERKSFVAGDFVRGQNQQLMMKAILNKVCSPKILTSFSGILDAISGSVETNLSSEEINALIQMQLSDMPTWDVQTCQIKGDPVNKPCYSLGFQNASVVVPWENSIQEVIDNIDKVVAGEKITTSTGEEAEDGE